MDNNYQRDQRGTNAPYNRDNRSNQAGGFHNNNDGYNNNNNRYNGGYRNDNNTYNRRPNNQLMDTVKRLKGKLLFAINKNSEYSNGIDFTAAVEKAGSYSTYTRCLYYIALMMYVYNTYFKNNEFIDLEEQSMIFAFSMLTKKMKDVFPYMHDDKIAGIVDTGIEHLLAPRDYQEPLIELLEDHDPETKRSRKIKFIF